MELSVVPTEERRSAAGPTENTNLDRGCLVNTVELELLELLLKLELEIPD